MSKNSFLFPNFNNHEDYVESWYPILSDLTFKTWIFNFTLEEGILLHRIVSLTLEKKSITENDLASLKTFLRKVSLFFEKVKKESPPNSGYFLRLGSRSLKDAVLNSEISSNKMKNFLYSQYSEDYKALNLETRESKISWVNQKSEMSDFLKVAESDIKSLKCYTLNEMFELFFNSERIEEDLKKEIESESPKFTLIFRLWDDRLHYQNEFRGFIYQHKFCALTQYDKRFYCKKNSENKQKILKAITDLYENEVKPRMMSNCIMPDGAYVIDFGVIFNNDNNTEAIVIEINPFTKEADSSLFHWVNDIDVLTGKKEFEFRLTEENDYNFVDYDFVLYPDLLMLKNQVKANIVNDNKTFLERHLTWRNEVIPEKW